MASYELWNPAKTLEEQSHSLHLPVLARQILSQSNWLGPAFQCSSISCLHVPSQSMTTGYKRMQASVLADRAMGVLDNGLTVGERGENREREREREIERENEEWGRLSLVLIGY